MDLQLERLAWEVDELVRVYTVLDEGQLHLSVYPLWDVSDVLRHLVWWHESFAAIAAAADVGGEGVVPRGSLAEVNARSVAELGQVSTRTCLRRLNKAQRLVEAHRTLPAGTSLGYRRGSRRYTFAERVGIAVGEMNRHRHDVLAVLLAPSAH